MCFSDSLAAVEVDGVEGAKFGGAGVGQTAGYLGDDRDAELVIFPFDEVVERVVGVELIEGEGEGVFGFGGFVLFICLLRGC